jgi:hypothetical protein
MEQANMANSKRTRSRPRRSSDLLNFPEVQGKIVDQVEVDPDAQAVTILFRDKTVLSFDLDFYSVIFPELSDWKTGDWQGIKRWRPLCSRPSMVKWP